MSQTSADNGDKNEKNSLSLEFRERLHNILIPILRKGVVKSTTCSLWELIVKAANAKSAFFKNIYILNKSINYK